MSDTPTHKVLDFAQPIAPEDVEVGNIIVLHGKPRTIVGVTPYHDTRGRLPHTGERRYADVGGGQSQCFYVFTCAHCGVKRAFPGLDTAGEWYGVTHGGEYTVFCSDVCVLVEG